MKRTAETQKSRAQRVKDHLRTKPGVPCEFMEIGEATDITKSRIDYQRSLSSDPDVRRERRKDDRGKYRVYWTFIGTD